MAVQDHLPNYPATHYPVGLDQPAGKGYKILISFIFLLLESNKMYNLIAHTHTDTDTDTDTHTHRHTHTQTQTQTHTHTHRHTQTHTHTLTSRPPSGCSTCWCWWDTCACPWTSSGCRIVLPWLTPFTRGGGPSRDVWWVWPTDWVRRPPLGELCKCTAHIHI